MSHPVHDRFGRARGPVIARPRRLRVVVLAAVAAIVGALQLAAPQPAAAISGLQRIEVNSELTGPEPVKSATAYCPETKHVIGGGGYVQDRGYKLVRLVELVPYSPSAGRDSFFVEAEAPNHSSDYPWEVTAYAICADRSVLGTKYKIVPATVYNTSPMPFVTAAARCPSGTVAYGSGAALGTTGGGQIGLQLNRTSGPLDISRATARESVAGYSGPWVLESFAICAPPQAQIHAHATVAFSAATRDFCDSGRTHGPGGGGGLTDGGPVWLQEIYPFPDLSGEVVAMTGAPVGGMVAHETCGL
jgi:hypothetical protein